MDGNRSWNRRRTLPVRSAEYQMVPRPGIRTVSYSSQIDEPIVSTSIQDVPSSSYQRYLFAALGEEDFTRYIRREMDDELSAVVEGLARSYSERFGVPRSRFRVGGNKRRFMHTRHGR